MVEQAAVNRYGAVHTYIKGIGIHTSTRYTHP